MTETRAEAQRLVAEGRVRIVMSWPNAVEAEVLGDHGLYAVFVYNDGRFTCTGPDSGCQYHSHTNQLCIHAEAVKLATGETI